MVEKKIKVTNPQGLHARVAASFVKYANKFKSDIEIEYKDNKVNGKSIIGILTLGVFQGEEITIRARGLDEKEAVETLIGKVNEKIKE